MSSSLGRKREMIFFLEGGGGVRSRVVSMTAIGPFMLGWGALTAGRNRFVVKKISLSKGRKRDISEKFSMHQRHGGGRNSHMCGG